MCGIGGIVRTDAGQEVEEAALRRMARALRHRGPDGFGLARGAGAGLVATRLAIVDLIGGWQPMRGRRGTLLAYNGEVFNHRELRAELARDGERLATRSDTEVVLALLERDGLASLERLNGQFALAWWDPARRRLALVRDRFGILPLHWAALAGGGIAFASEVKALLASGEVHAAPDLAGLDDVFTLWGPRAPRTAFRDVHQLPPGGLLVWEAGRVVSERRWWEPDYDRRDDEAGELGELLEDSVRLRLRADVPVGTYLSGGLDSSVVTALAQRASAHELHTFSVAFDDRRYDERRFQQQVAAALGTRHHVVEIGLHDVANAFCEVVWHCETPLVRTAPVPLTLLARAARERGITVVATGEGADELYWGYDLFKETAVRALHERDPARAASQLDQLYPYLGTVAARRGPAWRRFFLAAGSSTDPLFSHQTRIAATSGVRALYRRELREPSAGARALEDLRTTLPEAFPRWSRLERAAYLELTTLLAPYLLAAQGDRVAMAHGVEARLPFLDHRVFEHSVRLAPERKLAGLREKVELRLLAADLLPGVIAARPKQPYRAPDVAPFFPARKALDWVSERLSGAALDDVGIFDPVRVGALVRRCEEGRARGFRESMALVGVLSTQVWHERFHARSAPWPIETRTPRVQMEIACPERTESAA